MTETDIQRDILAYLKACHIFHWRNNVGGSYRNGRYIAFGIAGAGDIIGVLPGGKFFSIEIKALGATTQRKRAEAQAAFRDAINKAGGVAIVAHSLDDVRRVVESV